MIAEVRTTVAMSADLAKAIDDYRFDRRINTRPEAIRELLAYALDRKLGTDKPAKESRR